MSDPSGGDLIDGLTRQEREQKIAQIYGRMPIPPEQIVSLVDEAVAERKGLSLVRAGDVVSSLLSGRLDAIQIWGFLGIPVPPTPDFMEALRSAFRGADVIGLTHRKPHSIWLRQYLDSESVRPPYVADSFVNDSLFAQGAVHDWVRRYRVALVGRSAASGAAKLAEAGLHVAYAFGLEEWGDLPRTLQQVAGAQCELVLIGAGLSGRILATRLAREAGRVALDVGHVLDWLAYPNLWDRTDRRRVLRQRYKQVRRPRER